MKKKPGNGRGPDPAAPQQRARSVTKPAEYVGSFTVEELDLQQRAGRLEEQLRALKDCPRRRSVVLRFSLQGLKVYSADGETLLMAHALRRILYSTWSLPDRQFAFVARNPHSPPKPPGRSHSLSVPQERRPEAEGRAWRPGNPYCSPVLVRKKAIRSKVLRSGAYRDCGGEGQLHQQPRDAGGESKGARSLAFLPENESVLAESVWAFAGIARAAGVALLRRDVPGAFLLRPEPGLPKRWCLWVRAPCGVVSYGLVRTHQGRFCVEHSNAEFASVAALLAHYSGPPGGCFCRLGPGRCNPGYEERDPGGGAGASLARGSFPGVPPQRVQIRRVRLPRPLPRPRRPPVPPMCVADPRVCVTDPVCVSLTPVCVSLTPSVSLTPECVSLTPVVCVADPRECVTDPVGVSLTPVCVSLTPMFVCR
ncbi:PREDICTED: SH2 domain-containing protein 5 [Ficedula albicollis]|uniref:SH2 domain-containing protein 5 n=1 Tax=Ficedula albicollis TaxID=59894 RepID=UPI0007AD8959|nr:PREDICTED: SH2 domain-containing protein 5 [Ficedula albicollis]